jgi:hypothetical protein
MSHAPPAEGSPNAGGARAAQHGTAMVWFSEQFERERERRQIAELERLAALLLARYSGHDDTAAPGQAR